MKRWRWFGPLSPVPGDLVARALKISSDNGPGNRYWVIKLWRFSILVELAEKR